MKVAGAIILLTLLSGCGSTAADPSGVSATEASQLNDAATMLDDNSVSAEAVGANQAGEAK